MTTDFAIGTEFMTRGKHPLRCRVVDVLKTYNSAGELVQTRYVATHEFCGQEVTQRDIVATTIAMGLIDAKTDHTTGVSLMPATKSAILACYREELKRYPWSTDTAKLDRFMNAARETLNGGNSIDRTGHAWLRALELNGLISKKDQTLKALHALPEK